jgi:protein-S-isoprenylcysteine O-methyltransferase Ste14
MQLGWTNLWLPMLLSFSAGFAAYQLAARKRRPFVDPKMLEYLGEDGASSWRAYWMLELLLVILAVFTPVSSPWGFVIGLIPFVIGTVILFAGSWSRGMASGLLLKGGAYAYSRNPILTGRALVFIALLIMGLSEQPAYMFFLIAVFVSFLVVQRWIESEESYLERECGEEYIEYRKWVPRYLVFF